MSEEEIEALKERIAALETELADVKARCVLKETPIIEPKETGSEISSPESPVTVTVETESQEGVTFHSTPIEDEEAESTPESEEGETEASPSDTEE